MRRVLEVFLVFLRLGLTSFGGPVAHIGYFREEFVGRRRWLDDRAFGDLVALCQFLPGASSSQAGFAIGMMRGGLAGGFAAAVAFTLPSALLMIGFGYGIVRVADLGGGGWLRGLKIAAVAVVANAVWGMGTRLCPDRARLSLAFLGAILATVWRWPMVQVSVIVLGALAGAAVLRGLPAEDDRGGSSVRVTRRIGVLGIGLYLVGLLGVPLAAAVWRGEALEVFDGFYRSGALVFGGGHVVLPLLQAEVVPTGWVTHDQFLAGYGAAQALPGPLFTFAGFLGTVMHPGPWRWTGGVWGLLAIFLPSIFVLAGAYPFWQRLRERGWARASLAGANAAVVGLLLAALYDPVWTGAIDGPGSFALALAALAGLALWGMPPWAVVALSALGGALVL